MRHTAVPPHDGRVLQLLILPAVYWAGAKASLAFAVMPEVLVTIWIPNGIMLAALFHYQWRRFVWFAALIVTAEVVADYATFPPAEAALFGAINLLEVSVAYLLLRRWQFDPRFAAPRDIANFVIAAPLVSALLAACAAAGVYHSFARDAADFSTYVRIWWFSDGLGLLIFTPLALSLWPPGARMNGAATRLRWFDVAALCGSLAVLIPFLLSRQRMFHGLTVRSFLLLPPLLYAAARFSVRTMAAIVAVTAMLVLFAVENGQQPFGDVPILETVTSAQELIIVMSTMSLGIAALLSQQRANVRELETRVADRTAALTRANTELHQLAVTDPLTGLLNRRALFELLRREMARQQRYEYPLALIMIDIDHFKLVNDRHGHAAGDAVLQAVATTCASLLRSSDTIARYGGEEFVIVAPEADLASARQLAERLWTAVRLTDIPVGALSVHVTASFGVAMLQRDDREPEPLLRRADEALYAAKAAGRDRVVVAA